VLCFIPNESIYGFIHEQDAGLLDEALSRKVVFCSPFSLFAVLAVIRQAFDHVVLEQTSNEILGLLGAFNTQYRKFGEHLDKVGARIDSASKAYAELAGTRRRQLERPLDKLEDLRRQRGIDVAELGAVLEIRELPEELAG
jgi:DNA recombination protein RmuC